MAKLNRTQTILRNIACNWLGYVVQAAVVFFLTPYVLRELGDARYGVWALITTVTGTYGLLAFGLQGGVNQYLTRYLANRDFRKMNEVASTATAVLTIVGVAILVASLGTAAVFPYLFDVPADLTRDVRLCTVIVGASVAVQMSLFVFSSVFMATQRYDLSNAIGVVTRLASAGFILAALRFDYGLVGISAVTAASNIFDYLLRWRIAYRLVPELEISRSCITKPVFAEMFQFGAWSFVGTLAQTLLASSAAVIVGMMMPMSAMAHYALAQGLTRQLESILAPVIMVFFPAFTELHTRGESNTLRTAYLKGTRLFVVLIVVVAVISFVFAKDFFSLWVGNEYVDGNAYPSVAVIYQILLIGLVFRMSPEIGSQVLLATLNVRLLTITYLIDALGNVLFGVLLVRYFGLLGVAIASLLSAICFRAFTIPFLLQEKLGVSFRIYLFSCFARPLLIGALLFASVVGLRSFADVHSFVGLFTQGLAALSIAVPLVLFIGMTKDDRERFVVDPVVKMWASWAHRRVYVCQDSADPESSDLSKQ